MFKFSLTIATSVFLLMSGAADLLAMDSDDDKEAMAITHYMPSDVMGAILQEASKDNNPRRLVSVCKYWYNITRENNSPQMEELHYSTMNPFMQRCMNTFWENQFYNGILQYTPTNITLKFSDFKNRTFDLSTCGNTSQYSVITENMDRFFTVEGENKNKTVILITPRSFVEQEINSSLTHTHPFAALMADWDADKAPVGMFYRWGNDKNLACVDSLTTEKMMGISACNLFENWKKSVSPIPRDEWLRMGIHLSWMFHVNF